MNRFILLFLISLSISTGAFGQSKATNPIIHADVPDLSMIRVGDVYYMSSTTMHMSPGVPIMKSSDLVNWELVSYAYDRLGENDALNMENNKNAYGKGSWASSLRFHNGTFYVSTFSSTTGKTYIYYTQDIESGDWKKKSFSPSLHDNSLVFDKGKVYMIYGNGTLHMVELKPDLTGLIPGTDRVLIQNASAPAGPDIMLGAEGAQLFNINGKYYIFAITWPKGGMRTVVVHRADKVTGPYEGRLGLQDQGVAQGGLIDTPQGQWFAYLFKDNGAVGRIPYMVPVTWENDWPIIGVEGKVPQTLELPKSNGLIPGIVQSDDFERSMEDPKLPLVWQWNHNPVDTHWSLSERPGYLRLQTIRLDSSVVAAKNTLTQRTFGPTSQGEIAIDVSLMKSGDVAGLVLLAEYFGYVGVKKEKDKSYIVQAINESGKETIKEKIPFKGSEVFLKAVCDFTNMKDQAKFYYSLDGNSWQAIGASLQMRYTLTHFMGYRFGLFNYATKNAGGSADFDYFKISK
ncbi:glycoside hydrolase 43 family protein [Galbibacter sp.]|uniref:glycoside hydrolase family 43 protein n=1 Tax=Galbibacter sp. TaxID=2918471 RepID=UPI002B74743C|nr:glycoside hydrolase 43 family protein [Galbibacter sp.]HLV61783.1 glycoside hydrolase 43 family protein [Galbibacter sp.]